MSYIDIGVNITDDMFQGIYHGKKHHECDLSIVFERAKLFGVDKIVATGTNIEDSEIALNMCREYSKENYPSLYCTVGIHPTRCSEFNDDPLNNQEILQKLRNIIENGRKDHKVVAIGEIGLDYDRTEFCSIEKQLIGFVCQMELAYEYNLPIFFHSRNAHSDFMKCIEQVISKHQSLSSNNSQYIRGVVHSFTGSEEELLEILSFGQMHDSESSNVNSERHFLYIGFNGCSLKTQENCDLISKVFTNGRYIDHVLLETDAPWCGIKNTHFSKQFITKVVTEAPVSTVPSVLMCSDISSSSTGSSGSVTNQNDSFIELYISQLAGYPIKKSDKYTSSAVVKPSKSNKKATISFPDSISSSPTEDELIAAKEKNMRSSMVKDRNEPCTMVYMAQVLTSLLQASSNSNSESKTDSNSNSISVAKEGVDNMNRNRLNISTVSRIIYENTNNLFTFK